MHHVGAKGGSAGHDAAQRGNGEEDASGNGEIARWDGATEQSRDHAEPDDEQAGWRRSVPIYCETMVRT